MDKAIPERQNENEGVKAYTCQYTSLGRSGHALSPMEKYWQLALRIPPALKRRLSKYSKLLFRHRMDKPLIDTGDHRGGEEKTLKTELKRGDSVRIKPYEQIACTLNPMGKYKGLNFLPGMKRYCGQTATVLKTPRSILDRDGKKIRECKDLVVLDGLYCDGKDLISNEGCDRCCLYYWKRDWLEKADGNEKSCLEKGFADG